MTVRVLKGLAVACLAIAIVSIIASVRSTLRAGDIQGPGALVVLPTGEVWVGVDEALWRISAQGELRDEQPIRATGLPGPAANLVHGPDGAIVASVRGDSTLYFLDAASARVTRRLNPQWPPELQGHGGRAINFAFDAAGRVAIATGGGDAVALFEPDGRLVARTAAGAYVFTNGLWWSDAGLWTTDTNRFILRLLDGTTLTQHKAVKLGEAEGGSFLGPARGRQVQPQARAPVAALIRFEGDMTQGSLSLVGADGRANALPHRAVMEPRDVDWLGDELLASDGLSFSLLHWSAEGRAMPPFGDAALREKLSALASTRDSLRKNYARWLIAAGGALFLGLLFAALAPWAARRKLPVIALDLSRLGTPRVGRMDLLRLYRRLYGGLMAMALPMVALVLFVEIVPRDTWKAWLGDASPFVLLGFVLAPLLSVLLAVPLVAHRVKRLSRLPEFEPALNQRAMLQLKSHAQVLARALRKGEQVLETFSLLPGMSWWVLTDQRLLALRSGLFDTAVAAAHELADVRGASTVPGSVALLGRRRRALEGSAWLEIAFDGALPISGLVGSPVLAERVAKRVNALSVASRAQAGPRSPVPPEVRAAYRTRRWRRAVASALLPGLGQWQQRRAGEAIVLLAAWVAVVVFGSFPMLWTLVEPFTGVGATEAVVVVLLHLMLSGLVAADTWRGEAVAAR